MVTSPYQLLGSGLTSSAPASSQVMPAGYSVYVVGPYEIVAGTSLEIGVGACLEIG
jgi:hypothetical protein